MDAMDEKLEILSNWMNGKEAPPITIEINVTNRCNQKCLHCGGQVRIPHPAKFSPHDKYAKYRRAMKRVD